MKKAFSKKNFANAAKNILIALAALLTALGVSYALRTVSGGDAAAATVFVLAVFLVARFTDGYYYSAAASVTGLLLINYFFISPYYKFTLPRPDFLVTAICMLSISVVTSALSARIKQQERLRIDAETEKTRSNLLRAVSHDLRTPLTSILGATSAVIENDSAISPKERIQLLSKVREDAQWLIRMVENLLAITRINNTDPDRAPRINKHPEAVEELVSEAVTKFQKRFPECRVDVTVPNELLMVSVDAILIEQVIINLLENTALHGKSVTKTELTARKYDNMAILEVADDGIGISADILPHIFDGYFKKNYEAGTDSQKNMGIGLSVCNTIIKAHNGTMTAYNKVSGGAVVGFTLPVWKG